MNQDLFLEFKNWWILVLKIYEKKIVCYKIVDLKSFGCKKKKKQIKNLNGQCKHNIWHMVNLLSCLHSLKNHGVEE